MYKLALIFVLVVLSFFGCKSSRNEEAMSEAELKEHIAGANKIMVRNEKKDIEEFITRHQFTMDSTGTGLRYDIYEKGQGEKPLPHDAVVVTYRNYFLNGTEVYDVTESDPDTFRLAEAQQARGLEEVLFLMTEGARARIVVPAHLAYGMIGDQQKIPGATPLYYELHLIKINP
jgi:FKBP-type peptidyl-prolyl cis-trans isomerase FkpA